METWKLFWLILKRTHGDKLLLSFLGVYVTGCLLMWITEPGLNNLGDAFWLGYNIVTSIGLGDYTLKAFPARIIAVVLGIAGAVVAAFLPGLITSYYTEKISLTRDETIEQHYDELMNLHKMSQQQKKELAGKLQKEHKS